MEAAALKAEPRDNVGTRTSRKAREQGLVPGIIYGHGETPEAFTLGAHDLDVALAHGARTLEIDLSGKRHAYLIKEVQYDHMGTRPIHVDLARVDLTERVKVSVGIKLRGVPKGAADGGILEQAMAEIDVECVVTNIPQTLQPLVASLGVGDVLLVKDLELPEGVVAMADPDDRVAVVRAPLEEVDEAAETAEGEEAQEPAQPEVIGRVRKDDEQDEGKS